MTTKFDLGYKILHWVMAALVLLMFFGIVGFGQAVTVDERTQMLLGHSSMGTIIAILICIRIFKRFIKKDPVPEQNISAMQRKVSTIVQYAIYALLVWIPTTGYITANFHELPVMLFGNFNLNGGRVYDAQLFATLKTFHQAGIYSLMGLLAMHIGAALMHGIIKRDGVMGSMTYSKKD